MPAPTRDREFDIAIVGLGAIGSAAAYHLSRRGLAVCGVDRFEPPHDMGSSHGSSRIIREAYAEDPLYVPLLQRAYELWEELEHASGRHLLTHCGGLMLGEPESELVEGAQLSARQHGLDCKLLSAEAVRQRWPDTFAPAAGTVAIFDPRAGVLAPESCIEALLDGARAAGARLRAGAEAVAWSAEAQSVQVELADGSRIEARQLLLAAGPWMARLEPALAQHLQVTRQVMHWFEVLDPGHRATPERFPVFMWEHDSRRIFYGFPDQGEGLKVAIHHEGESIDPEHVERDVTPDEVARIRALLERYLPGVAGAWLRSAVCMYTNTADGHFLVDRHPEHPNVILASPCSGHGFKFVTALGEAIADLFEHRRLRFSIEPFRFDRLTRPDANRTRVRAGSARFVGSVRDV